VAKTITFADALPADFAGTANTDPAGYKVVSNYGVTSIVNGETYNNVINNSGTISSRITAAEINADKTGRVRLPQSQILQRLKASQCRLKVTI